jgi:hypothetical protein
MTQPPDRAPLAWPLAAAAVLVLVLALVGAGVVLTRRDPSPSTAPGLVAPTLTPRPPAPTPPAVQTQPTAAPPATAAPTGTAAALASEPKVEATPTAALVQTFTVALPTPTPTGWWDDERPVGDQALSNEVLQAYHQFWQVRAQALYELDPSKLVSVTAGTLLEGERRAIEDLRAQNQAQQVDVDHNARVLHASAEESAVEDVYLSRTVRVNAESKERLEATPSTSWRVAYRLRKLDGVWKVVDSVRVTYVP